MDHGARLNDVTIGRWGVVDPLAELSRPWSPYNYGYDNPVRMIDPDGMLAQPNDRQEFTYSDGYSTLSSRYATGSITFEGAYATSGETGSMETGGPGPGKGKKSSPAPANPSPATGTLTDQQYADIQASAGETGQFLLELFDTFNGTNLSGINSNPNQGYIGGGAPSFGFKAPGLNAAKTGGSIWTSTKKLSSVENAFGHFKKHGAEFPEFYNAKQYVEGAKNFLHNSPTGTLMKTRTNGDILKYHPVTNTFGVMDASGVLRTMFRPSDGMKYWLKQ
ncbi:hypothetical protein GCM10027190_32380 [Spirosoma areae]